MANIFSPPKYPVIYDTLYMYMYISAVFLLQGEVGGAGSVCEWRDSRTGVLYNGFPYAHWTEDDDIPHITTALVKY